MIINKENLPKIDEGTVYPKMSSLIYNQKLLFDLKKEIKLSDLQKLIPEYNFIEIAECVLNIPDNFPNSKRAFINGPNWDKKLIDYIPKVSYINDWKDDETQWVYCIVYGDYVVKIGMTASGMAKRYGSYNTGTVAYMRKGTPATTNFVLSQCNYAALLSGLKVKIYAYKIPTANISISIFGEEYFVMPKVAYKYEEVLIKKVVDTIGHQPILCGFSDNEK